jgi:hypothetical protein
MSRTARTICDGTAPLNAMPCVSDTLHGWLLACLVCCHCAGGQQRACMASAAAAPPGPQPSCSSTTAGGDGVNRLVGIALHWALTQSSITSSPSSRSPHLRCKWLPLQTWHDGSHGVVCTWQSETLLSTTHVSGVLPCLSWSTRSLRPSAAAAAAAVVQQQPLGRHHAVRCGSIAELLHQLSHV